MNFFSKNSPIFKVASIQLGMVAIFSIVLIFGLSLINNSENLKKTRSIYETLEGKINEEIFINNSINAKKDIETHSVLTFKEQLHSNSIEAIVDVSSCLSTGSEDLKFNISSLPKKQKCVHVKFNDDNIIKSIRNTAYILIILIIFYLPIYFFTFRSSLQNAGFEARSELADEVVHGISSPLARFELVLRETKGKLANENTAVLESVYEDFKYQFLKLSYTEVDREEKKNTEVIFALKFISKMKQYETKKDIQISFIENIQNVFSPIAPKVFREIFDNIFNNAIDAIKSVGKIEVEAKSSKENLIITIKDNGVGISQDKIANVFEKGFSTKRKINATGLGLGLHHSKKELEKVGGNIKIRSKDNQGTTVVITLPIIQKNKQGELVKHRENLSKKIILVDDDSFLLTTAKKSFQALGYQVDCHSRPEDCLEKLKEEDEKALILYDFQFLNSLITGLQFRKECIDRGLPKENLILISGLAEKVSKHEQESLLYVAKTNFNDVITLVQKLNPIK